MPDLTSALNSIPPGGYRLLTTTDIYMGSGGVGSDEGARALLAATTPHDPTRIVSLDEAWNIGAEIEFTVPASLTLDRLLSVGCKTIDIARAFASGVLRSLGMGPGGSGDAVFRFPVEELDGLERMHARIGDGGGRITVSKCELAGDGWDGAGRDFRIITPAPEPVSVHVKLNGDEARYLLSVDRKRLDPQSRAIIQKVRDAAGDSLGPIRPDPRLKLTILALEPDEAARLRDVFAAVHDEGNSDAGARLLAKIRAAKSSAA